MNLQLEHLKTFSEVALLNNFTKAALRVNLTQSAVSMQMKRLEEEVGEPLFNKDGKRFQLTRAGETLLEYSRRILSIHDEAVSALKRPDLKGHVRFGAIDDYACRYLPRALSRFATVYPNIRVDVFIARSEVMMDMLKKGELDMTLCTETNQGGEIIHTSPVVWAASREIVFKDDEPRPLAVYHKGCIFRKWATEALSARGIPYRIAYTSPSIYGIMAAVRAGLATAPVNSATISPDVRILGVKDGFPILPAASIYLHKAKGGFTKPLDTFADFIVAAFNDK